MTKPAPEARIYSTALQLRDTQLVGKPFKYIEGRAVPYEEFADVGWYLEKHREGSLDQTTKLAAKGLPLHLFHNNRSWPIGLSESWDSQADGLHGVWRLNETSDAQQAATLANSGELGWLSIGFSPVRSEWEYVDEWAPELGPDHMDRVTRVESRLLEVSVVSTPAFASAEVTMVRTAERARPRAESKKDGWMRELDRIRTGSIAAEK
jgi:HK97 family phage prohead protease